MKQNSRVRPFPAAKLEQIETSELVLAARSGYRRWLPEVAEYASAQARRLGLGSSSLRVVRVQAVFLENLRAIFPGRWRFAVFAEPLSGRMGFLALDSLLVGRVAVRFDPGRLPSRGWMGTASGDDGVIGWMAASALEELAAQSEERFGPWRYLGLAESAGEVGRACRAEDAMVATWVHISVGWEEGFSVWLEADSSILRRQPQGDMGGPSSLLAGEDGCGTVSRLELPLALVVGRGELLWEEVCAIEVGDVVLLNEWIPGENVRLQLGPLSVWGKADGRCLTIVSLELEGGGAPMGTSEILSEGKGPGLEMAEVGRLPLELVAESGRVELTVAQVAALKVGDVLTLPEAVLGPVDLRVGRRLVGRGELVDVEGRRGVRLLEVTLRSEEPDENPA